MAYDIKALKSRIKSVDSTFHLTKAMGLVASSKVRRATEAMINAKSFASSLNDAVESLSSCRSCQNSVYMKEPGENVKLIVIAGDRGLAGGYNNNVFKTASQFNDAQFLPIGKRACDKFGEGYISCEKFSSGDADELTDKLLSGFANGEFDRLGIIMTEYISIMKQEARVVWPAHTSNAHDDAEYSNRKPQQKGPHIPKSNGCSPKNTAKDDYTNTLHVQKLSATKRHLQTCQIRNWFGEAIPLP
ncbi:MAG: F0F1 ATP synthase subunit gamma, partial [Clostridia bacterium]|nr:F0F1 ATP synthase subunit gamma [Clostridia bacterium]